MVSSSCSSSFWEALLPSIKRAQREMRRGMGKGEPREEKIRKTSKVIKHVRHSLTFYDKK